MGKQKNVPDQIEKLQQQVDELDTKWRRALADYQNLERRVSDQRVQLAKLASVGMVEKLVPLLDDLKRAQAHLKDAGIEMITKRFSQVLESEGVSEIKAEGEEFSPLTMECVDRVEGPVNKVVSVQLTGYRIGDYIIRPAQVAVGAGQTPKNQEPEEE